MINFSNITDHQIDAQGIAMHESKWVRQQRIQAWNDYKKAEYPHWKKTKTPKVSLEDSTKASFPEKVQYDIKIEKKPPVGYSGKITFQNNSTLRLSLDPDLAYRGVIFCDMQTALLERADLLEAYISKINWSHQDKLSLFQQAWWQNGFFLFIPKNLQVELPFQVQVVQKDAAESILSRSVIIADESSSAIVEELFESMSSQEEVITCSTSTEVFAEKNANIHYSSHQDWAGNIYDLSYRGLHAKADAKIQTLFTLTGGKSGRLIVDGKPENSGSRIEHDAIIVGAHDQQFKIIAEMDHQEPHTEGFMKYKGILKDKAYTDLSGLIRVGSAAQMTNSRLEEHTVLLSEKSRCDALPALDIQTDDVQVSHSAAVTQADEEKLFYLMSRGLDESQARTLIVEGFFEDLLATIHSHECYEQTKQRIQEKMLSNTL